MRIDQTDERQRILAGRIGTDRCEAHQAADQSLAPGNGRGAESERHRESQGSSPESYGQSAQQAKASTQQALDEFGLNAVASQKAHTLSGGMQRRLSIAMGLITNPKILFLDEPTVGLDIFARRELWNVIKGLKGRVTILLTTHYLEEVEALADRIAIMVAGRTIAIGTVAELKKQTGENNLEDAFVKLVGGNNELA